MNGMQAQLQSLIGSQRHAALVRAVLAQSVAQANGGRAPQAQFDHVPAARGRSKSGGVLEFFDWMKPCRAAL